MMLFPALLVLMAGLATSNGQSNNVGTLLVQVKMGPFVNCSSMTPTSNHTIGLLIRGAILSEINLRCNCDLELSSLKDGTFHCNKDAPYYPTYRLTLSSHGTYSAAQLASFMDQWVQSSPTVTDNVGTFTVDPSCTIYPDTRSDDPCPQKEESSIDLVILVGAMMTEFIVLLIIFFISIAILLAVFSSREKKKRVARKMCNRKRLNSYEPPNRSRTNSGVKMHSCEAYVTTK